MGEEVLGSLLGRGGNFWAVEFLLHAGRPVSFGKIFSDSLPLTPSRAYAFCEKETALAREGETILYISFQRGAMVASGDRPSPTEAAAETKLPLWNPRWGRKRGKIIYLFGDGVFGGKLLQSPKGDSCRGEGVNTGSRATLSALCPGGLAVAAVFFGKQKKSRRSLKDFLLRGGAGERRGFCFERAGAGKRGFWRYQKSRFITGITVPASHSA